MRKFAAAGALLLALPSPAPEAAESAQGHHDRHCLACHGTQIYTRANRTARDYRGLRAQVELWQKNMSLNWGAAEVDGVTAYLAQSYYKLSCPGAC